MEVKRTSVWILFLIILLNDLGFSQHCPFDNLGIIVVDVRDSVSGEKIDNLFIHLMDKNGITIEDFMHRKLIFVKNPVRNAQTWKEYDFGKIRYSFADDNYILPLPLQFYGLNYFIEVKDTVNSVYKTRKIQVEKDFIYDLHPDVGHCWIEMLKFVETPKTSRFHHSVRINLSR